MINPDVWAELGRRVWPAAGGPGRIVAMAGGERRWAGWFYAGAVALVLIKLWLTAGQMLVAIGPASHDDRLFLNLAEQLLHGHWLGPYDEMTLIKGMFYPLWVAGVFALNLPLLAAQHLLYAFAAGVLLAALRPLLVSRPGIALLFFGVLLFNPDTFTQAMLNVRREGIYPALTLLVAAGAIGLMLRHREPLKRWLVWVAGLGAALPAFWLTREEGVWMLPVLVLLPGWTFVALRRSDLPDRRLRSWLCLTPLILLLLANTAVATVNLARYGSFTTVEFKNRDFLAAYGALTRVKPARWIPHVPVTKETRERLYALSPAFAELKPHLEGEIGNGWAEVARQTYPELKGTEIAGGWFMWALRRAVAVTGHCASARDAMAYYRRLAREINAACDSGTVSCLRKRASMAPPWRVEYLSPFLGATVHAAVFLVSFQGMEAAPFSSMGPENMLVLFRDMTHERLAPMPPDPYRFKGWVFGEDPRTVIEVRREDGSPAAAVLRWNPSPDVRLRFQPQYPDLRNIGNARFEITLAEKGKCFLDIRAAGRPPVRLPLDGSVKSLEDRGVHFYLDEIGYDAPAVLPNQEKTDRVKIRILNWIGKAYRLMPLWVLLALLGFARQIFGVLRRGENPGLALINLSLGTAVLLRLAILAQIHATSFPSIQPIYLAPAYPMVILFCFLAVLKQDAAVIRRGNLRRDEVKQGELVGS